MPTSGATIQNKGSCSTSAPNERRMRLVFAFCSAKPNCIPMKPKLMVMICPSVSGGLGSSPRRDVPGDSAVAIAIVFILLLPEFPDRRIVPEQARLMMNSDDTYFFRTHHLVNNSVMAAKLLSNTTYTRFRNYSSSKRIILKKSCRCKK